MHFVGYYSKSAVILSFCASFFLCHSIYLGRDAVDRRESRAVIRTGQFSPFGSDTFTGHQMWGQERGSGGPFLASQIDFCYLTANISKTVSRLHT